MINDKFKLFKFTILTSIICAILTGVNYLVYNVKVMGIAFIITTLGSIFNVIAYRIEKKDCISKK